MIFLAFLFVMMGAFFAVSNIGDEQVTGRFAFRTTTPIMAYPSYSGYAPTPIQPTIINSPSFAFKNQIANDFGKPVISKGNKKNRNTIDIDLGQSDMPQFPNIYGVTDTIQNMQQASQIAVVPEQNSFSSSGVPDALQTCYAQIASLQTQLNSLMAAASPACCPIKIKPEYIKELGEVDGDKQWNIDKVACSGGTAFTCKELGCQMKTFPCP